MKVIVNGKVLSENDFVFEFESMRVEWNNSSKLNSLLISKNNGKSIVFLAINITGNEFDNGNVDGDVIIKYREPRITKSRVKYDVLLMEQIGSLTHKKNPNRTGYDMNRITSKTKLISKLRFNLTGQVGYPEEKASESSSPENPKYDKRVTNRRVSGNFSDLPEKEAKYCRCVLHVAAKQGEDCIKTKFYRKGCYNPYAVCAKATGASSRRCGISYNLDVMPYPELKAYANLMGIKSEKLSRNDLIEAIRRRKEEKYG